MSVTLAVARGILLESALSFFGVGVRPPQASWGNMLYQAQATLATEPWLALAPGLFILLTTASVNVAGDRLAAGLDQTSRARSSTAAVLRDSVALESSCLRGCVSHSTTAPRVAGQQQLAMRPPRRDAVGHHALVELAQVERDRRCAAA